MAGIAVEVIAALMVFSDAASNRPSELIRRLRSTSLIITIGGAATAMLSYLTGDAEADRLWDRISPAAQQLLPAEVGGGYLSHAVLGHYLMDALSVLAVWRLLIEFSATLTRWRLAYLLAAIVAVGVLLYQGKTCGELVYEYGVGVSVRSRRK